MPAVTKLSPMRLGRAAGALGLALILSLSALAAAVAEEEEETFEQSVIRGLLGGKSRGDIDYRERSPLVIPPSRDTLPPPDSAARIQASPAWPHDPDRRKAAAKEGITGAEESERESMRGLRPDELRRGTAAGKGRVEKPAPTLSDNEMSRPLRPSEYSSRSLFDFWSSTPTASAEPFVAEPTRSRLTEPPPGYRTPASGQPYQAPKDTPGSWFKSLNIFDRGLGNDK